MHSTIFLTKPDEHGEQQRVIVVELISDFDTHLENHEQFAQALNKDLQYRVVYDCPSHLKKKGKGKEQYDSDQDNPDDRDSDYDDLLTYNEVVGYINKEVTDESGEYWRFWKILGIQYTPPKHKIGSEVNTM